MYCWIATTTEYCCCYKGDGSSARWRESDNDGKGKREKGAEGEKRRKRGGRRVIICSRNVSVGTAGKRKKRTQRKATCLVTKAVSAGEGEGVVVRSPLERDRLAGD
jgi:hypothetical protein